MDFEKSYTNTPISRMYEVASDGRLLLTMKEFESLVGYNRHQPIAGAFDINRVDPEQQARLVNAGYLPIRGDVRAVIAFKS